MDALLSIRKLSIDFIAGGAQNNILHDISFDVCKGEIVAIVGESGSGKSVTALSVLRLLSTPPAQYNSGQILFDTGKGYKDLLSCRQEEMQEIRGNKVAMIFQEPMTSLNPVKTCGSQVSEAIMTHRPAAGKIIKQQVLTLFEKMKLPEPSRVFYKYPHQLSGGQKQRVMIAMAMSCNPQLLICDEPTTALDVRVQRNILLLIRELQQQANMGVIFITHDLGVVSEIADRILVMYQGKIIEAGKTIDILSTPLQAYTKALLACRPSLHRKGEKLPVVSDFMQTGTTVPRESANTKPVLTQQLPVYRDEVLMSVKNLHVWYPAEKTFLGKIIAYNKAVNGVNFDIYKGETLGLVGESGCGKTTLGRALLGLIPATSGKIFFQKKDLSEMSAAGMRALRKDIQIIFQDPYSSLNPRMKIGEAIAEPLKVHGLYAGSKQRKEKVMELLEKVKLDGSYYNRYPHEFSGGQRQRIVIARALALEPSFVVCDESVSALDVSVQAQVLNLLNELKAVFNFTALFISHDLSVIRYISDRIMVMNNGMIEETGEAEDIYHNPASVYTQQLIEAIPGKRLVI